MDLIAAGMESATRKSAPKKRRISERVDWLNREVMAVLRMMDGDKSITLSAGSDLIERITGRRVDNATMCRRLRWLRESANSWEKLSSAQLGEGEADGDKPERDGVDTDIEGLYELLYRPKCRQIDGSRVRQSVDAETAGSCILSTLHNNGHNLTCERMVECGSDPTATTVSATCDASSTRPLWRRILTWHSENGSTESQVPIADASNCTVDEGDRYEQTEGEGFCVKEENGADPSVATAEPTYSIVHTSFPQKTTSTVNCSTDMSDIVPSRQVQNNCVPAAECLENANIDLHMFSEADLMPSEGSSQCCPLPINSDRPIPAISSDTNRRRRIMRNCVSGRVSVRDIRRYNVLSKNAAARRIAAESQQGAYRNNVSIGKAQMRSRRHCTGNNDMNSTGSDDSLSTLIRSPITTKCKTRSVAVGSDRVLSLRDKRMDDALLTIEGLLSKVGTIQRDEFNNLGDSVADCLRGVNRVDAAAAAQFKLELLEMMARYQKATLFK